jgi:hypothetical protein
MLCCQLTSTNNQQKKETIFHKKDISLLRNIMANLHSLIKNIFIQML